MSKQYPGGLITKTPVVPSGPYENSTASGIWTLDQQAYWRKLNQWPIAGSVEPDPQFNYVTMLLHGDGTNGAQNNTFLDSSTNNFTITRNGNTTQGSFSPYGSNWSNYFDGTGDYLSIADNAALDMGSSSFTIEGWFLPTADVGAGKGIFGKRANNGVVGGLLFYFSSTGLTPRLLADIGGSWGVDITASSGFTLGQWNHFATVRNSNTWTIYINGTSVGSATNSGTVADNSAAFTIMAESAAASEGTTIGYISNFRVVKGSAVYTTSFTPSTTPLTAITDTSLLTCQSNRFVDNSANNFTITRNGDTSVQRFNPFGTATAYSTSVIGGSGYFDGTGDYLTAPDDAGFSLGSNNFTIESWVYPTASPAQPMIIGQWTSSYAWTMQLSNDGNRYLRALLHDGSFNDYVSSTSLQLNAWNHCAFVRESNTVSLYLNGARVYTTTFSGTVTNSTSSVSIGADASGDQPLQGYITNSRVVNGTALYSGTTYTVPTAPLTAVTNTSILLNTVNAGIFDNAMMNDLETVGNAQISTSVKKYGTGSIYFDGSGDRLYEPSNQNFNFGTGDFTIELWAYPISQGGHGSSNNDCLIDFRPATGGGAYGTLYIFNSGTGVYWYANTGNRITGGAISNSVWTHIAICRSAGSTRLFLNGVQSGSTYTDSTNYLVSPIMIGEFNDGGGAGNFNGYIDDLRITKGFARYTSTFTPPTAAFSDVGPT